MTDLPTYPTECNGWFKFKSKVYWVASHHRVACAFYWQNFNCKRANNHVKDAFFLLMISACDDTIQIKKILNGDIFSELFSPTPTDEQHCYIITLCNKVLFFPTILCLCLLRLKWGSTIIKIVNLCILLMCNISKGYSQKLRNRLWTFNAGVLNLTQKWPVWE